MKDLMTKKRIEDVIVFLYVETQGWMFSVVAGVSPDLS